MATHKHGTDWIDWVVMIAIALAVFLIALATGGPAKAQVPQHGPWFHFDSNTQQWLAWYDDSVWDEVSVQDAQGNWHTQHSPSPGWYVLPLIPERSWLCVGSPLTCWWNSDRDPYLDVYDTCIEVDNVTEVSLTDFDSDGYGGVCDGDFNNGWTVNITDYGTYMACQAQAVDGVPTGSVNGIDCRNVDMDSSGLLTVTDLGYFYAQFQRGEPGPGLNGLEP